MEHDFVGERLITLDELLQEFGDTLTYHIEIKDRAAGIVPAIIDCVRGYDLIDSVFIAIINDEEFLLEAKRLEPRIRTALDPKRQMEEMGPSAAVEMVARSHDMVTLTSSNHTAELVDVAHRCGIEAPSSGIVNRDQMIEAVEIGCNGMTMNWPDWLLDYISLKTAE